MEGVSQEMAMENFLQTTNLMANLQRRQPKFILSLSNALTCNHSHFLPTTLSWLFWGHTPFFSLAVFNYGPMFN